MEVTIEAHISNLWIEGLLPVVYFTGIALVSSSRKSKFSGLHGTSLEETM